MLWALHRGRNQQQDVLWHLPVIAPTQSSYRRCACMHAKLFRFAPICANWPAGNSFQLYMIFTHLWVQGQANNLGTKWEWWLERTMFLSEFRFRNRLQPQWNKHILVMVCLFPQANYYFLFCFLLWRTLFSVDSLWKRFAAPVTL